MSWVDVVQSLLSGIDDPQLRINASKTIFLILNALNAGAPIEEVKQDIMDIIKDIIEYKHPELTEEEVEEKAEELAEQIIRKWKVQKIYERKAKKYGLVGAPP